MKYQRRILRKFFEGKESFKVIFTLYGNGKTVDRHELTDFNGNKKEYK